MSIKINDHLNLLGHRVTDRVTGMGGIVTSISFDLYGCIQAVLHPGLKPDGTMGDQLWFDVARLEVHTVEPVMQRPAYEYDDADAKAAAVAAGNRGAADKPAFTKA